MYPFIICDLQYTNVLLKKNLNIASIISFVFLHLIHSENICGKENVNPLPLTAAKTSLTILMKYFRLKHN